MADRKVLQPYRNPSHSSTEKKIGTATTNQKRSHAEREDLIRHPAASRDSPGPIQRVHPDILNVQFVLPDAEDVVFSDRVNDHFRR